MTESEMLVLLGDVLNDRRGFYAQCRAGDFTPFFFAVARAVASPTSRPKGATQ